MRLRRRLRKVNPGLFLLAEAEEPYLFEAGAFDACYAWEMHHLMNDVAQQTLPRDRPARLHLRRPRPLPAVRHAPGVHLQPRREFVERLGVHAHGRCAREIMAAFTFVVPRGLPLVYTGQEIGYDHSFAFFDRDPIPSYAANSLHGVLPPPGRAPARQPCARRRGARAARWSRYATTPRIA